VIRAELHRYLPFLATTALLVHAVRSGKGREEAHAIIKEHAISAAIQLRDGTGDGMELLRRLGADQRFPGETSQLRAITDQAVTMLGMIDNQINAFCSRVADLVAGRPEATYAGSDIV
jgi:adenylosuccinate lyase